MSAPAPAASGRGSSSLAPGRGRATTLAWVLAAAVVAVQVAYPLLLSSHRALTASTVLAVLLFAAASLVSAAASHGVRAALALLLVAGGVGLAAESVGVATGVPFGAYAYAGSLGPQVAGVPVIVPLAWTMMAWPTLLAGRAVVAAVARRRPAAPWARARWLPVLPAAWALAAWDLYLDPQMVAAGHWAWQDPSPALPGVPGIPLTNFAGWLLVALVIQALLHAAVGGPAGARRRDRPSRSTPAARGHGTRGPPAALLAWTWLGSGLANLAFFSRPWVGLWGLAAMGAVVGPYLLPGLLPGLRARRSTVTSTAGR